MNNQGDERQTSVTRVTNSKKSDEHPLMSFTAVMSHQAMAEAFINELVRVAQRIIPDRDISPQDLVSILQVAMADRVEPSITMVGGRHLRARISEQVSRARRYNEPFSLLVLHLDNVTSSDDYEAIVDTLRERMRQTDFLFLFKVRIVILLPHADEVACSTLVGRIKNLVENCLANRLTLQMSHLTYPHSDLVKASDVLDWTENQLRTV